MTMQSVEQMSSADAMTTTDVIVRHKIDNAMMNKQDNTVIRKSDISGVKKIDVTEKMSCTAAMQGSLTISEETSKHYGLKKTRKN